MTHFVSAKLASARGVWRWVRSRDYGRKLRVLAGVDEDTLSWVHHNRARYTGVGGVVLSTAVIAGLSMTFALSQVAGGFHFVVLIPALIWAVVVLNLDRWLISSATGTRWSRRTAVLLPRFLVAVLLGFVIAEPVVLRLFETAVEQNIHDGRDQQARALVDELVRCNPMPEGGRPAGIPAGCAGKVFALGVTPQALAQELATRERDAAAVGDTIKVDSQQHADLEELARKECAGGTGPGLTGVPGVGGECRRLRKEADDFQASHQIEPKNAELAALNARISQLRPELARAESDYQKARQAEIDRQHRDLREHQKEIGLLERFQALHELTGQNSFLWGATWLIRLFFIVLDCLPILVKLMGGTSAYDRLVDMRTSSQERIYGEIVRSAESAAISELELRDHQTKLENRKRRKKLDLQACEEDVRHSQRVDAAIADYAARLREDRAGPEKNGHAPADTTSTN